FVPGLAAFLAGHGLYIGGFLQPPAPQGGPAFTFSPTGLIMAAGLVVAVEAVPAVLVIRSLLRHGRRELLAPVLVYVAAIITMVVIGTNVGSDLATCGAILFLVSDTVLALERFVTPIPRGPLAVHMTYHLGQGLLVLSLLR
ncbi:MAG: lysoplasmalogenase family protein, partial [Streptosporangiaceae bacterium]